jgi:hypothetical protein
MPRRLLPSTVLATFLLGDVRASPAQQDERIVARSEGAPSATIFGELAAS